MKGDLFFTIFFQFLNERTDNLNETQPFLEIGILPVPLRSSLLIQMASEAVSLQGAYNHSSHSTVVVDFAKKHADLVLNVEGSKPEKVFIVFQFLVVRIL